MGTVGELLEKAARATPALVEDRGDGWWLRLGDARTWWASAVLAHGGADRLTERIAKAERFYAGHATVARFQVCPDCPSALDHALAGRGYRREAEVHLLTAAAHVVPEVARGPGLGVRVDPSPGPGWQAVLRTTSGPDTDVARVLRHLTQVGRASSYLTVVADGDPVGIGRAVSEGAWTGIFDMVTAPAARRRGVARLVLRVAAEWSLSRGVPGLYLQVEESNAAARRLYAAAGFRPMAKYHYRVQSGAATG